MKQPLKVYLTGGEGSNWALDQDFENTRHALSSLAGQVELVELEEAEIIHSVWHNALNKIDPKLLSKKKVICHICTNPFKMMEDVTSALYFDTVDLWVTQTGEANKAAEQLTWPHFLVPYAVNLDIFGSVINKDSEKRTKERQALGIKDHEFLIGNFMRDSLGSNLNSPKPEKGADIFLEIIKGVKDLGLQIHVLLAGPRRHWLRKKLTKCNIPFTFIGQVVDRDDMDLNILSLNKVAALYNLIDLSLITSRHEGGPRAILEAAASSVPILSTPVGLAKDLLAPSLLYSTVDNGIEKLSRIIQNGYDPALVESYCRTVCNRHSIESVTTQFSKLYKLVETKQVKQDSCLETFTEQARKKSNVKMSSFLNLQKKVTQLRRGKKPGLGIKICLWHEFHTPPYGGGNQFMLALRKGLRQLGVTVVNNQLDDSIDVHICNALWFDEQFSEKLYSGSQIRIIHRLDGLVHIARGQDDRFIDDKVYEFNRRYASVTVMQSEWCLKQAKLLGFSPVCPLIIKNSCDSKIFYPKSIRSLENRRIRIIGTSWSDNPMKGGRVYKQIEDKLDWSLFDFTFAGRTQEKFSNIRKIKPLSSKQLGDTLRQHDIYITASRNEACSNALIEALSCGLPALYINDSSHPEIVGWGGLPFNDADEAVTQLHKIAHSYQSFCNCIQVDTLRDVSMQYLNLALELLKRER
ncbi:MAG: glycosyltransferase [Candidatus Electrothrix sp. LOE2]|nr:glycosyltransferase [Candidatus Electrothrix sp. LOE2]